MRDRESTARAREIGSLLRKMREKADIRSADLARTLGWSVAKLSRTELGLRVITELDVVRFTAYCGASHYEVNHMAARCREAEIPGYWLTDRISSLIFHESATNSMVCYQPMIIPGLLQTFDYAMALIAPRQPVPAFARHHAEVRMQRQHILRGRPFTFFIHEQALRLPVGGSQVMNEQLLKLVLLAEHPSLSIRVVPTVAGERAMLGGQFALMWFPDAPPLSYVETGPARLFLEASEYLDWYRAQVGTIGEVALNRGQSRSCLPRWQVRSRTRSTSALPPTRWRRCSCSAGGDHTWVEVAFGQVGAAARDFKNRSGSLHPHSSLTNNDHLWPTRA